MVRRRHVCLDGLAGNMFVALVLIRKNCAKVFDVSFAGNDEKQLSLLQFAVRGHSRGDGGARFPVKFSLSRARQRHRD
jgi:hypothetical protein